MYFIKNHLIKIKKKLVVVDKLLSNSLDLAFFTLVKIEDNVGFQWLCL